ncbi:hypothetical protein [Mycolicibacter arupensis]|jgi:hypothetical protein|uniref:Uncharacterized protein n=1 Tax=Mycolicibacter arupensis TaxID=342002 RepID=A0A5C7XQV6_9MYCO|nr:hypothetical protein [Mycolicibacter arupensis]TXI51713.1 MAG: hypothetical protein E6Q54_20090 [Mycolicibacter arupensis]
MTTSTDDQRTSFDVFDAIHDEMDALPPESWTDDEACRILAVLVAIRHARDGVKLPGWVELDD